MTIGSNVIVGAGSIVTKSILGNEIVAGNPVRHIASFEQYREKVRDKGFNIDGVTQQKKKELLISYSEK